MTVAAEPTQTVAGRLMHMTHYGFCAWRVVVVRRPIAAAVARCHFQRQLLAGGQGDIKLQRLTRPGATALS